MLNENSSVQCPNCDDKVILTPDFLKELQTAVDQLAVELVDFCVRKRIDHRTLPALTKLKTIMQILDQLR